MIHLGSGAYLSLRFQQRRFLQQREQMSRLDRAFQQLTRRDSVATAQLVQGGLVEDRRMLGIDGFDAQEQRIGARASPLASARSACEISSLTSPAACETLKRISCSRPAGSLASVRGMIDNAAGLHRPFVRRRSCMQS